MSNHHAKSKLPHRYTQTSQINKKYKMDVIIFPQSRKGQDTRTITGIFFFAKRISKLGGILWLILQSRYRICTVSQTLSLE